MIPPSLLIILRCPETQQPVSPVDETLLARLNAQIEGGTLKNRSGTPLKEKIEGGFIRQDQKLLYPVVRGIPVFLIGEAIPMDGA